MFRTTEQIKEVRTMTRKQKINALINSSNRENLVLYRYFLNQKTDAQLDTMIADVMNDMNNVILESMNS